MSRKLPDMPTPPTRGDPATFSATADDFARSVDRVDLREALILAALAGFSATKEGFNGECPYPHLVPDDEAMRETFEWAQTPDGAAVRAAVEIALHHAGLLGDVDLKAASSVIDGAIR